ncbi:MAG: hypothetical protein ACJASX_003630 [Limisphaerales bacterium]|jgi:hypothetical protein
MFAGNRPGKHPAKDADQYRITDKGVGEGQEGDNEDPLA